MPVTWCYQLEDERQYCSTGFPMGCFSRESRSQVDTCSINVNLLFQEKLLNRGFTKFFKFMKNITQILSVHEPENIRNRVFEIGLGDGDGFQKY